MIGENPNKARASLLMGQNRLDRAEEFLRLGLADEPDDAVMHAWMALCLAHRLKYTEATEEARMAVGLAPDDSYTHFVLGHVYDDRNMPREAMASAEQAAALAPEDPRIWALIASIHLREKRFREALEASERGLQTDAEDVQCANLRAAALRGLGRPKEAAETVAAALSRAPDSAHSHANMGWTLLHQGKPREAIDHFREALRLQPGMDWARAGIVEALKARNPVYRVMLAYFLFMARLPRRAQWFIIIGGVLGNNLLGALAQGNPALAPWIWPIRIAYIAFALMSMLSYPLFNLLLRTSRLGRHALTAEQTFWANALGLALIPPVVSGVWTLATGSDIAELVFWMSFPLLVPVAAAGLCRRGLPRRLMAGLSALLALACIGLIAAPLLGVSVEGVVVPYVLVCLLSPLAVSLFNSLRERVKG